MDEIWLIAFHKYVDIGMARKPWLHDEYRGSKRANKFMVWKEQSYIPTVSRRWLDNGHYFMATAPYGLGREAYDIGMEFRRLIVTRKDWKVYKGTHCEDAVTEKLFWMRMGK